MLRLIGIVVSIGLADSLNPTTIAPALYLATGERPRERVTLFIIGVFLVYLIGDHAVELLGRGRDFLNRRWPVLVAGLALLAGVIVILLGATGIAGPKSRFTRFVHRFRP